MQGASWIGENNGGVIGGLAACGILYGATNAGASVTGDFKTGVNFTVYTIF